MYTRGGIFEVPSRNYNVIFEANGLAEHIVTWEPRYSNDHRKALRVQYHQPGSSPYKKFAIDEHPLRNSYRLESPEEMLVALQERLQILGVTRFVHPQIQGVVFKIKYPLNVAEYEITPDQPKYQINTGPIPVPNFDDMDYWKNFLSYFRSHPATVMPHLTRGYVAWTSVDESSVEILPETQSRVIGRQDPLGAEPPPLWTFPSFNRPVKFCAEHTTYASLEQ